MARSNTCCLHLPLVMALFLLLLRCKCRADHPAAGDRETLLAVKHAWGNPPQLASWDPVPGTDHCSWKGVKCADGGGIVTELSLHSMKLSGTISALVCELKNLTRLDLSNNSLNGTFPAAALYACSQLRFLDISGNAFTGVLPADIESSTAYHG
ncbi:unnamed protein product [Urochloa humidicola]